MSDFEDTSETPSPRPLPEILGPISREERGKLFEGFAREVAEENFWFEKYPSHEEYMEAMERKEFPFESHGDHLIDKDRLLLIGVGEGFGLHDVHRVYYTFESPNTFREAANFDFNEGGYIQITTKDSTEGDQHLSVDIVDNTLSSDNRLRGSVNKTIYPRVVNIEEKGKMLDIVFIEIEDRSSIGSVTYYTTDERGVITEEVTASVHNLHNEDVNVVSPTGKLRIISSKEQEFFSVEEKGDSEFTVIYRIPKKINTESVEKLMPFQHLPPTFYDVYNAPATADKWRHADFLEVLGIERGEAETEIPEL